MIFDEAGNVVWFDPLAPNLAAANLQVEQYDGRPVLTWWQGYIPPQGFGQGEEVIDNSAYQPVLARVHDGQRLQKADLHDFHITPAATRRCLTVFNPIDCNLSWMGGRAGGGSGDRQRVPGNRPWATGARAASEWQQPRPCGALSESFSSPR